MKKKLKKTDIFISYRRKGGGLETAAHIRDCLQALGYRVFMDTYDMRKGEKFLPQIEYMVRHCKDVILVLPPDMEDATGTVINALDSYWVKEEVCYALKYRKKIYPILMKNYKYPDEKKYPQVSEKFKEDKYVIDEFKKIKDIDGIHEFNVVYLHEYIAKIRKNLNAKPRWKKKEKAIFTFSIITALLALITISKLIYNYYMPKFSLAMIQNDNENNSSWDTKFVLSNTGQNLSGGKVVPKMYLGVKVVSKVEGDFEELNGIDDKYGFMSLEFYDFYKDAYFFDDTNNSVTICENGADNLLIYLKLLDEELEKKNMYIDMYAIKTFFDISYTDIFGITHKERYDSENNYNYMFTGWSEKKNDDKEFQRYIVDNRLIKGVMKDDNVVSSMPILNRSISSIKFDISETVKDIKKYKNTYLTTNVYDTSEAEINGEDLEVATIGLGKGVEFIENENGLVEGIHINHLACDKNEENSLTKLLNKIKQLFV